jgi:transcriptional regulator with XRE-family HTH domain
MDELRPGGYSPTIRKRSLSRKLVELRKACGLTTAEVQRQLNWSASKLNYIEKAKWIEPSSDAVADLCELYGVEGAERDALVQLCRDGRQRGWWRKYNDVFPSELPGFEAGASQIRTFETTFLPGLLQVPAYIQMVNRAAGFDQIATARYVDARLARQQILTRDENPCELHAVIDENAFARITDPGIRREQLDHLAMVGKQPNVTVQILPFAAGAYPVVGAAGVFAILGFPDPSERDIVYLESAVDDRMLEEADELRKYTENFDQLSQAALSADETRTYLEQGIR